jgi:hypothetical protein
MSTFLTDSAYHGGVTYNETSLLDVASELGVLREETVACFGQWENQLALAIGDLPGWII